MQIDREHATEQFKPEQPNNLIPGNNGGRGNGNQDRGGRENDSNYR